MKALQLQEKNQTPVLSEVPVPKADKFQKVVQIKAAALNHRDVWIVKGMYPGLKFPAILGSDGAGLVDGREVVIQPGINWGADQRFQQKDYHILGLPENGTFAESVVVNEDQLFDKPSHLSFEEAAALPLAGLTAFRALFSRCQVRPGEKVLITGIGGGVALFCLQFALAIGAEVYVTSGKPDKIERAIALGAKNGVIYKETDWSKKLETIAGGFDVVIDSAGGDGFAKLVKLCNPGARIGIYGGSNGVISGISPQLIFWRQISILGSTMGSEQDFEQMLAFVNRHKIIPIVDTVFPIEEGALAFERMARGEQFGKIVLKVS